jgi:hypothetical protein
MQLDLKGFLQGPPEGHPWVIEKLNKGASIMTKALPPPLSSSAQSTAMGVGSIAIRVWQKEKNPLGSLPVA